MRLTTMDYDQANMVAIPIPGVEGMTLVYHQDRLDVHPQRVRTAATILAHWLKQGSVPISSRHVRDALRRFTSPWLLGETELAYLLFGPIETAAGRGAALRSLLEDAIERMAPCPDAPKDRCRAYLILRQLYVERRMPEEISHELGLSVRQYQRCLSHALSCLSEMLVRDP